MQFLAAGDRAIVGSFAILNYGSFFIKECKFLIIYGFMASGVGKQKMFF